MSGIATAIAGSAVIGAVASNAASSKASKASKNAAQMQRDQFDIINQQNKPFMDAGYGATTRMQQLLGIGGDPGAEGYGSFSHEFSPDDFLANKDPGYGFELQQGQQALQNSAAGQSGALSGAAIKDLLGYSQGYARTGYNDAFNRYQTQQGNIFSRLSGISQMGQNAAANVGSQGTALAGQAGQALTAGGQAAAAGTMGIGNSLSQGLNNYWLYKNLAPKPAVGAPVTGGV